MKEYIPVINTIIYESRPLDILRLDLIDPFYGGNKYFKLKYNIDAAKKGGFKQILTFGGAHSNHLYSTAALCKELGIAAIGVIRGEDSENNYSPTLNFAKENGMKFHFVSRDIYRRKNEVTYIEDLKKIFGEFYLIPEGGANAEGVKGCTEILTTEHKKYDYVFCACGTAGTYSGIKIASDPSQKLIGISVLKGENALINDANEWFKYFGVQPIKESNSGGIEESTIIDTYHFGGYAKFSEELVNFKKNFEKQFNIPLDYIYTSKLFYAVCDLINKKVLPETSSVLLIHSGGLQGNFGFEKRYQLNPTL